MNEGNDTTKSKLIKAIPKKSWLKHIYAFKIKTFLKVSLGLILSYDKDLWFMSKKHSIHNPTYITYYIIT